MLKHSYALKMGAKKNNPTLNQVRVKEEKKKFIKETLDVYTFFWKIARGLSEAASSVEIFLGARFQVSSLSIVLKVLFVRYN